MTQVHISSPNHTVTINHDGSDLSYVIEKAQKLWDDTKPADSTPGAPLGFTSQVNLHTNGSYRRAHMPYGEQPVVKP